MMKQLCLLWLCLQGLVTLAQTPITLSNSNMPGSGDTLRYTNIQLSSLGSYTQTGANTSWDFTDAVSGSQGLRSFKSALLTPYALLFFSVNEYGEKLADTIGAGPLVATNYYDFYKKSTSPNAFVADGAGITFSSIPLPAYYSDKDELYNFPMTYPKFDSTTFRFSTLSSTLIPIRYSKTGYRLTTVDGWGIVATPNGTANCLRLITTQYSMDSIITTFGSLSIPFGFQNYVRSYQWLTSSSKIPYLEITGSLIGSNYTVTQARYRGYPQITTGIAPEQDISAMQLYPNPVSDKLWLNYTGSDSFLLTVLDVTGQVLSQAQVKPGVSTRSFDVSQLPPGLYVIKAERGQAVNYLKFIKN